MIREEHEEKAVAVERGAPEFGDNAGLFGLIHHAVAVFDNVFNAREVTELVTGGNRVDAQSPGGSLDEAPVALRRQCEWVASMILTLPCSAILRSVAARMRWFDGCRCAS